MQWNGAQFSHDLVGGGQLALSDEEIHITHRTEPDLPVDLLRQRGPVGYYRRRGLTMQRTKNPTEFSAQDRILSRLPEVDRRQLIDDPGWYLGRLGQMTMEQPSHALLIRILYH
jgi:hypothetical protein